VLLAVKLFPLNLLWLNGVYWIARMTAGLWAALRNRGDVRHYQGLTGKLTAAWALAKGTLSAVPLIPAMLRKRRSLKPLRRLTPVQMRRLLLHHRIPLKELSEQGN
jgi:hypothetical protein